MGGENWALPEKLRNMLLAHEDGVYRFTARDDCNQLASDLFAAYRGAEAELARLQKVLTGSNAEMDGLAALFAAEEQPLSVQKGERHTEFVKRIARSYNRRVLAEPRHPDDEPPP